MTCFLIPVTQVVNNLFMEVKATYAGQKTEKIIPNDASPEQWENDVEK